MIYGGLMWLDLANGSVNPADMGTKQIRDTAEFLMKDGILRWHGPIPVRELWGALHFTKRKRSQISHG